MTRKTFILTEWLYKSLAGKGKIKKCYLCGKEFKIGDKVRSVNKRGKTVKSASKWICIECLKKYNIW